MCVSGLSLWNNPIQLTNDNMVKKMFGNLILKHFTTYHILERKSDPIWSLTFLRQLNWTKKKKKKERPTKRGGGEPPLIRRVEVEVFMLRRGNSPSLAKTCACSLSTWQGYKAIIWPGWPSVHRLCTTLPRLHGDRNTFWLNPRNPGLQAVTFFPLCIHWRKPP